MSEEMQSTGLQEESHTHATQNGENTEDAGYSDEFFCPECGTGPVVFQEGRCFLCYACGFSKCG
ncbi:hypothetical protein KC571_01400 [candidate division WWE3 bacterium]|uniref:Uncharacterized protein n=1 Tax=candidate division WWE3 bacterium TaxID=2053526 RepID=A0A955LG65_UNCKA|nr:hypothetical protein [candidate division WWE3 bacterium]